MYCSGTHRALPGRIAFYARPGSGLHTGRGPSLPQQDVVFSCFSLCYQKFHPAPRTNFPNLPRKPPHTNGEKRVLFWKERLLNRMGNQSLVSCVWVLFGLGGAEPTISKGCPCFFFLVGLDQVRPYTVVWISD